MKKDDEVKIYLKERKKGCSQELAAARAGMDVRTARKYEKAGSMPSQTRKERTHRTRPDIFKDDWSWVQSELERDSALQAKTLFDVLCLTRPGIFQESQLRTLQRRVERWRALVGPDRTVMFEQIHYPGRMAQSDFTEMDKLEITIAGIPFPHLLYHMVLTYSNQEAIRVCFSESFESLAEGIEMCLWQFGGVPEFHRTDNLSAAVRHLDKEGKREFTKAYEGLMNHCGMTPTRNAPGESNQNGDVEKSHDIFKEAVDQSLRVRGSRDFASRAAYETYLQDLVRQRNLRRTKRFTEDREALKPLPTQMLAPCREEHVKVSRFSTVRVLFNTYSVPSRLIGSRLNVKMRSETLDMYLAGALVLSVPRLKGRNHHQIDYRHVIWSLVRKPGAFEAYRYREELFPTTVFRRAYDDLIARRPEKGTGDYLRILHLAALESETDVAIALEMLLDAGDCFDSKSVKDLVSSPKPARSVPQLTIPVLDLTIYDRFIPSRRAYANA